MKTETYYIKKGRKYIPIERYNVDGLSEGLWLLTKTPNSESRTNLLYAIKTHDLQNVGRFADFYNAHKEKLQKLVAQEYESFISKKMEEKQGFSISELTDCIISALSKIED